MAKQIKIDGQIISVPDDATPKEIDQIANDYESLKPDIKTPEEKPTNYGRLLAQGLGGALGGVAAVPASIVLGAPTMGLGAIATEAAGIGLGSGIAGQGYDYLSSFFDKEKPKPFEETAVNAVKEVGENAAFGPVGRTAGAALGAGLSGAFKGGKYVYNKIIDSEKPKLLAKALLNKIVKTGENTAAAAAERRIAAEKLGAEAESNIKNLPVNAPKPEPTRVGQATEQTSTIGVPVQKAIIGTREAADKQLIETDKPLRGALNKIVENRESDGLEIINTPSFKEFKDQTDSVINWATKKKTEPDINVKKVYALLKEQLYPRTIELTKDGAEEAVRNGLKIRKIEPDIKKLVEKNGVLTLPEVKYVRDVKPTFEKIDIVRKYLGQVFKGEVKGYGAIEDIEKQKIYNVLDKMEKEFAGKIFGKVQKNYSEGLNKIKSLEGGIGSKALAEDPTVVVEKVLSGTGEKTYNSLVNAAGSERIARKALSDTIASAMTGKNYKQTTAIYNKFKQTLFDPKLSDLKIRVEKHLVDLADNERAGIETAGKKLDFGKTIEQATKEARTAGRLERISTNRVAEIIAEKEPRVAVQKSMSYLKKLADRNEISQTQYNDFLKQANQIDFAKPEATKRAVDRFLQTIAALGVGAGTVSAGTSAYRAYNAE